MGRNYFIKPENISQELNYPYKPIGIFSRYKRLTLEFPEKINASKIKVYALDLMNSEAVEITEQVK